jgi:hypothetical protein
LIILLILVAALFPFLAFAQVGKGTVLLRDNVALGDRALITLSGWSAPVGGRVYVGWFVTGDGKTRVNIGRIDLDLGGNALVLYDDPNAGNILSKFATFSITEEVSVAIDAPKGKLIASWTIPSSGLVHIRHLLSSLESNPNGKGIAVGLREQTGLALEHARLALTQAQLGDLAGAKGHSEQVVNIIEGKGGPNFGDVNRDGTVQNPGDGRGVLGYAQDAATHAKLAREAAPRDPNIEAHVAQVADSAKRVEELAVVARGMALRVISTDATSAAVLYLVNAVSQLDAAFNGKDVNGNGVIESTSTEGGAVQAYDEAQRMGAWSLTFGFTATLTPRVGDPLVPMTAAIALLAGIVLLAGGGLLFRKMRCFRA